MAFSRHKNNAQHLPTSPSPAASSHEHMHTPPNAGPGPSLKAPQHLCPVGISAPVASSPRWRGGIPPCAGCVRRWTKRKDTVSERIRGEDGGRNQRSLEGTYCVPGSPSPGGPYANITSIVQTGRLPRPLLSPEPVCAHAERSVRMRQEGLGRQANGEPGGDGQEMEGKGCGRHRMGSEVRRTQGGLTRKAGMCDPQISPG